MSPVEESAPEHIKDQDLDTVLMAATDEEIRYLRQILDIDTALPERNDILDQLNWLSSSTFGYIIRNPKSYLTILKDLSERRGVPVVETDAPKDLERKLVEAILKTLDERLSPDQKRRLAAEIEKSATNDDRLRAIASAGGFAALAAAQASGFGVYVGATTALSVVTQSAAMTAPFWVYTGLTQAISLAIGPAGWIAWGLSTVLALDRPNYKKLLAGVLVIASLRSKQEAQARRWVRGKPSARTMLALAGALVLAGAALLYKPGVTTISLSQDLLMTLPSIASILFASYGALQMQRAEPAGPQSPHIFAGGILIVLGLVHAFTPLPDGRMSVSAFCVALGVLAYSGAYVYQALFGSDIKEEPFVLKRYLGQVDVRLTKERIFTLLIALAGLSIWSAFASVPLGVSLAAYLIFILLIFYAGERVYNYAGPLLTFLVAAFMLTSALRGRYIEILKSIGIQ